MCSAIPLRIADIGSSVSPGSGSALAAGAAAGGRRCLCGRRCGCRRRRGGSGSRRSCRRCLCGRRGCRRGLGSRRRRCGLDGGLRGGSGRGLPAALDEGEDVLLRHAAARARSLNRARIDAVLGGDPSDDGRDEGAAVPGRGHGGRRGRRGRHRRCGRLRGLARGGLGRVGGGLGRGSGASGASGASAGALPSGAITARTVPTSTVSPSWTRIWATTPSAGLGTSVSTLSVEISSSGSSRAIGSPRT